MSSTIRSTTEKSQHEFVNSLKKDALEVSFKPSAIVLTLNLLLFLGWTVCFALELFRKPLIFSFTPWWTLTSLWLYYQLIYVYMLTLSLESSYKIKDPLMVLVLHLVVVVTQVTIFSKLNLGSYLEMLRALPEFVRPVESAVTHVGFTAVDYVKFVLVNLAILLEGFYLPYLSSQDPLQRNPYFYKIYYDSYFLEFLGLFFAQLWVSSKENLRWVAFRYSALIAYWAVVAILVSKFLSQRSKGDLSYGASVYSPDKVDSNSYFEKNLKAYTSAYLLKTALRLFVWTHTIATLPLHLALQRLTFYLIYQQFVQLMACFFNVLQKYGSLGNILRGLRNRRISSYVVPIAVLTVLHIVQHAVGLLNSSSLRLNSVFLSVLLFQGFLRLVRTNNRIYLES